MEYFREREREKSLRAGESERQGFARSNRLPLWIRKRKTWSGKGIE